MGGTLPCAGVPDGGPMGAMMATETSAGFLETSRRHCDGNTEPHRRDAAGFYRVQAFPAGTDMPGAVEVAESGGVRGPCIARLQCHCAGLGIDAFRKHAMPDTLRPLPLACSLGTAGPA
jgi:hypothetical protein